MSKFKKGDRFRCVPGPSSGTSSGWILGKEFTIGKDASGENPILWPDDCGNGIYADSAELISTKTVGSGALNAENLNIALNAMVDNKRYTSDFVYSKYEYTNFGQIKNYNNITFYDKIMNAIKKIPAAIKKLLTPELQSIYKAGFLNEDLTINSQGRTELLDILAEKFRPELAARAEEIIKEIEAESK